MTAIRVRGMTCQGCEEVVETAIELLDGVEDVTADRYDNEVEVVGDVSMNDVADKVEMAGYRAGGTVTDDDGDGDAGDDADEAELTEE